MSSTAALRVRRALCAGLFIAALVATAGCSQPPPPPYRTVSIDWTGGVERTHADVAYGSHPMQRADIYSSTGNRGTIVFLHGGGWTGGDKTVWLPSMLLHEVARGYDLVSINYRLAPADPFPAAIEDTAVALRWVAHNGSKYGLSTERVVLAGHSAGANIAALAAFGANEGFQGMDLPRVSGVMLFAGAYDFTGTPVSSTADSTDWLAKLQSPGGWLSTPKGPTSASAVNWLDAQDPSALAIHGSSDAILSVEQLRALERRSASVGHAARMQTFEVTSAAFEERCRGHVPWCGVPVDIVDRFLDSLPGSLP